MISACYGLFQSTQNDTRRIEATAWINIVKEHEYKGVIFDCDGTLAHSEDAHFKAFESAVSEQGFVLEKEWYLGRTGLDRTTLCYDMQLLFGSDFNPNLAISRSQTAFTEHIHLVKPLPTSAKFVKELSDAKYRLAVGTSCEKPLAKASIAEVGLLEHFSHFASVSDGLAPKPSPQIFERAAARLKLGPEEVLVIEDSPQGIQAAINAKMDVMQLIWP